MADFDLNAILNSLTPDDIENLKQTAASVLGGMGGVGGYLVIASVDIENDVGHVTNGK